METTTSKKLQEVHSDSLLNLELSKIRPNTYNQRKKFKEADLQELADNIRVQGVIQPISVRQTGDVYEIICGERRYRASLIARMTTIPAILKRLSAEEALEIAFLENIQRKDISPLEEAEGMRELMHKRNYSIEDLKLRLAKSENYIRTRLRLTNLAKEYHSLLENEELTMGIAFELAKYSLEVQKEVFLNHFISEDASSWTKLTSKDFIGRMERSYACELYKFTFDKSDCAACNFNSAVYDLFEDKKRGKCMNLSCLKAKKNAHVVNTCKAVKAKDEEIELCTTPREEATPQVLSELKELGLEVKELNAEFYPIPPRKPFAGNFSDKEKLNEAMFLYQAEMHEYEEELTEIESLIADGHAKKYLHVGNANPSYCFVRLHKKQIVTSVSEQMHLLEQKDKRNKEIAVEKIVSDSIKLLETTELVPTKLSDFEEEALYFIMLSSLKKEHYVTFGFDANRIPSDDEKIALFSKLTSEQKVVIKRDYLTRHLSDTFGLTKKSGLLVQFAKLHLPQQVQAIENTHYQVFNEKHKRTLAKMDELKTKDSPAIKSPATELEVEYA